MALLKCNVLALPLIFNIGGIDLSVLRHHLEFTSRQELYFAHYDPRFLENETQSWEPPYYPENQDLVALCVISWGIAKSKWFYRFQEMLKGFKGNRLYSRFFRIYKIILEKSKTELPPLDYCADERQAPLLDAVYSYFKNSDAEGAACRRIIELMNRLMGADLSEIEFPDYDLYDRARIAWHTNREDFNEGPNNPRKDAIRKYNIKDDRPVFQIDRLR